MWTSLLVVAGTLLGQAEASPKADLELSVRRLVRQLDAPQLAERQAAEAALTGLGPPALVHLPSPGPRDSAELRQRLDRIRKQLEQTAAEEATSGSTVTLQADSKPPFEILAAIAEQTGNAISDGRQGVDPQNDPLPRISVKFEKTPFWQALDEVLDRAELTVYPYGEKPGINVVPRPPRRLPRQSRASYSGPFRFEPISVFAQTDLRDLAGGNLQVTVEISWEPKVRPISIRLPMGRLEVTDGDGRPLKIDQQQTELESSVTADAAATELAVPLPLPPRSVQQIGRMEGVLHAMLPGKIEEFRFDNLLKAKNVEKRVGAVAVTLDEVRRNRDLWEVRVRVRFDDAGSALESHRDWIFQNEAYLVAPGESEPIDHDAMETFLQDEHEVGIAFLFYREKPPADLTFVYKTPAAVVTTEFPFRIENVELP